MEQEEVVNGVSRSVAVLACAAMAIFYVAILYAPALLLRLPPPTSYSSFMIRRFICAAISSVVSFIASALILSVSSLLSLLSPSVSPFFSPFLDFFNSSDPFDD